MCERVVREWEGGERERRERGGRQCKSVRTAESRERMKFFVVKIIVKAKSFFSSSSSTD